MSKIERILDQHQTWLAQMSSMVAQELEYLDEDLACDSLVGLENVPDSLGMLAIYHGIKGEVAIYGGDSSGWEDISRAIIYRYWALRLRVKVFSTTRFLKGIRSVPNLTNQLTSASCLLAAFIVADRHDLAESVADILGGMLTMNGAVDPDYQKTCRFEPFMLWLYSVYSGRIVSPLPEPINIGVYQKVIDNWDDEENFPSIIEEVCKYHLANSEDKGGGWDPEFKSPPFDLLPLEVVAILKVRQQIGQSSLSISNNLLFVDSAALENLFFEPDDVAIKVEMAYNNFFS
ncbi:hypothetical protein V3429_05870 [Aeromonas jandaei]|uniref:hypothetical protein n=1 Tax=Aeromonas TaxID=642 RepID=UPI000904193A|nr:MULTISPECIES: hypothetical protein [unclassified Aeromonas]QXC39921.1 hypothetical protein I6L40_08910 [Aeromonas sp. FDAARGOS 1410]